MWWRMLLSTVIVILPQIFKSPSAKEQLKDILLQIRDSITAAYPEG